VHVTCARLGRGLLVVSAVADRLNATANGHHTRKFAHALFTSGRIREACRVVSAGQIVAALWLNHDTGERMRVHI
jgi:hypothetical protein